MISLRPSLITEHHSVSSLNEESRKSRRKSVQTRQRIPGSLRGAGRYRKTTTCPSGEGPSSPDHL